ncbi:hypothetical protein C8F01DRAFT_1160927 [Mycena amicta]|nr:hypothetical protein C8F01DRAFT_1160927 [Mycena amicta]
MLTRCSCSASGTTPATSSHGGSGTDCTCEDPCREVLQHERRLGHRHPYAREAEFYAEYLLSDQLYAPRLRPHLSFACTRTLGAARHVHHLCGHHGRYPRAPVLDHAPKNDNVAKVLSAGREGDWRAYIFHFLPLPSALLVLLSLSASNHKADAYTDKPVPRLPACPLTTAQSAGFLASVPDPLY